MKNLKNIVIHVGPEKCGSTSIQQATAKIGKIAGSEIHGILLPPKLVVQLNEPHLSSRIEKEVEDIISKRIKQFPTKNLVISHESFFKMPQAVLNMVRISERYCSEVIVTCYIRKQADFLASSFGQWIFRSRERILEARKILEDNGLECGFFSGVERHLLAAKLSNWHSGRLLSNHNYINWYKSIYELEKFLNNTSATLKIGVLPTAQVKFSLINDFLSKIGANVELSKSVEETSNSSFHPILIEATVNAIEAGYQVPGPHNNGFYIRNGATAFQKISYKTDFLETVKSYINHDFISTNESVALKFNLPASYFESTFPLCEDDIREIATKEIKNRSVLGLDFFEREAQARAFLLQIALREYRERNNM